MKKIYLIIFFCSFSLAQTFSQTSRSILFKEDFESVSSPDIPSDWETYSDGANSDLFITGLRGTANKGGSWPVNISNNSTRFAYSNDDYCGGIYGNACNKSKDYLEMPEITGLNGNTNYKLFFNYYFDKRNTPNGLAYVEFSVDNGTWTKVKDIMSTTNTNLWQSVEFELANYANASSLKIRFVFDDEGLWASGLAIDDVLIAESLIICDIAISGNVTNAPNGLINITVSNGTAPFEFSWTGPDGFNATTEDISGLFSGLYAVIVEDANGCTATESFYVDLSCNLQISGSVTNAPNGSITLNVSGGTAPFEYTWTGPNGFSSDTKDVSGLTAGQYSVNVRDANGCSQTKSFTITLNCNIVINGTVVNPPDGSITITVTNGTNPLNYSWSGPGGFTATTQNISNLNQIGTYTLTVTDANSCSQTKAFTLQDVSIYNFINENPIKIYPNPNEGVFNVSVSKELSTYSNLLIFNAFGQFIYEEKLNDINTIIDVSSLAKGIYFVKISSLSYSKIERLILK
jgi:acylphosphatase